MVARKLEVQLLDDMDGSAADGTLKFGLDGVNYEVDLSAKHADELRASLAKFVLNARRIGRGGVVAPRRRAGTGQARSDRAQNQAIRDWARRKKIELSDRGRIPRTIVEQFEAEAGHI